MPPSPVSATLKNALCVAVPVSGALLTPEADAQTVFTVDQTISYWQQLNIDVDGQSFALTSLSGTDLSFYFSGNDAEKPYANAFQGGVYIEGFHVANLTGGTLISASLSGSFATGKYLNDTGSNNANWAAGTQGYVGFRFVSNDTTFYGYADVTYTSDKTLHIGDVGFQEGGIVAGASAIPEPSTYVTIAGLVAGSAALLRRRQQRKAAAAA